MNSFYSQLKATFDIVTPSKYFYDSDQDTNDTASQCSQGSAEKLIQSLTQNTIEIDVKPKRKFFPTAQEKQKFVAEYQKKWKTELCKNFMLKGNCPYGNTCCFAHGNEELLNKNDFNSSYKTKPCKKYFLNGYCPYGYRCQYLHHDIKNCPQFYNFLLNLYKSKNIMIDTRLENLYSNELKYISKTEQLVPVSSRLAVFQEINNMINN